MAASSGRADRWARVSGGVSGEAYAERFAELAASGTDVHGEAAFCGALVPAPARVLDAGCGTGRVAARLAELGYECVGVDVDPSMLAVARRTSAAVAWELGDLAELDLRTPEGERDAFDLVVAAGNVIPLVAPGTEDAVVGRLAAHLRPGAPLVAGFGLDPAHLPLPEAPLTLADYDASCDRAGLELQGRFATWEGAPYDGGGYVVSVHVLR